MQPTLTQVPPRPHFVPIGVGFTKSATATFAPYWIASYIKERDDFARRNHQHIRILQNYLCLLLLVWNWSSKFDTGIWMNFIFTTRLPYHSTKVDQFDHFNLEYRELKKGWERGKKRRNWHKMSFSIKFIFKKIARRVWDIYTAKYLFAMV